MFCVPSSSIGPILWDLSISFSDISGSFKTFYNVDNRFCYGRFGFILATFNVLSNQARSVGVLLLVIQSFVEHIWHIVRKSKLEFQDYCQNYLVFFQEIWFFSFCFGMVSRSKPIHSASFGSWIHWTTCSSFEFLGYHAVGGVTFLAALM